MRRAARAYHRTRSPITRAPRHAADNEIGDEGAKELAAALKTNTTLTTLNLRSACSGAPAHPRGIAARAHMHVQGGVRRAARAYWSHALGAPTTRVRPAMPQTIGSAMRGPRSWPPRSRPTRPSPR